MKSCDLHYCVLCLILNKRQSPHPAYYCLIRTHKNVSNIRKNKEGLMRETLLIQCEEARMQFCNCTTQLPIYLRSDTTPIWSPCRSNLERSERSSFTT